MTGKSRTIASALNDAADELRQGSESHRLDAETLLAWVLDVPRSYLFAHADDTLGGQQAEDFEAAVVRRKTGEPVALITGSKEFWSIPFSVTGDTLVPRPETELLVEKALELIPIYKECRLLELGTGSGAIAVAIASEHPEIEIVAIDSSPEALAVAKENASRQSATNIRFLQGHWIAPVTRERFDLIVSNPPYVRDDDPALDELAYEPQSALAAGPDGLDAIGVLAFECTTVIAAGGTLLLEHGAEQKDAVAALLSDAGWTDIRCFNDLAGHPRMTTARMENPAIQDQPCSRS